MPKEGLSWLKLLVNLAPSHKQLLAESDFEFQSIGAPLIINILHYNNIMYIHNTSITVGKKRVYSDRVDGNLINYLQNDDTEAEGVSGLGVTTEEMPVKA